MMQPRLEDGESSASFTQQHGPGGAASTSLAFRFGAGALWPGPPGAAAAAPAPAQTNVWGSVLDLDEGKLDELVADAFQFEGEEETAAGMAALFPAWAGGSYPVLLGDLRWVAEQQQQQQQQQQQHQHQQQHQQQQVLYHQQQQQQQHFQSNGGMLWPQGLAVNGPHQQHLPTAVQPHHQQQQPQQTQQTQQTEVSRPAEQPQAHAPGPAADPSTPHAAPTVSPPSVSAAAAAAARHEAQAAPVARRGRGRPPKARGTYCRGYRYVQEHRERQKGALSTLVKEVESKLEQVKQLTAENEMLQVRPVSCVSVKGRWLLVAAPGVNRHSSPRFPFKPRIAF
jgi:hypothetical protein